MAMNGQEILANVWSAIVWFFTTIVFPACSWLFDRLVKLADHYAHPEEFDPAMLRQRTSAILELIQTEEKYRQYMTDMNKYRTELEPLITPDQAKLIFGNVTPLILLSEQFSEKFESERNRGMDRAEIHKCFENSGHLVSLFVPYSQLYQEASAFVAEMTEKNKAFRQACEKINADGAVQPLTSLLVMPIQRMTKYPLLIKEVLKATPTWHPDHVKLQERLKEIQEGAQKVDRKVDEAGRREAMLKLQETVKNCPNLVSEVHRVLLERWPSENGDQEYVLLTDMLLILLNQKNGQECKKTIPLEGQKVEKLSSCIQLIDGEGNVLQISNVKDLDGMFEMVQRQVQAAAKRK